MSQAQARHLLQLREEADLLLGSPAGRRTLYNILAFCGVFQQTFDPDPYKTAYNEGRRSVGLALTHRLVVHNAAMYERMVTENLPLPGEQQHG